MATEVTPELERALVEMQPWMHPFRFGPDTIVGDFKHHIAGTTVCVTTSPAEVRQAFQRGYSDHLRGRPDWPTDMLVDRFGADNYWLDIACATGAYSFRLALRGAGSVHGVEIRPEQVRQARFIQELDSRFRRAPLRFDHVSESAESDLFLPNASYDVCLSLGLLYHLNDPPEHLRQLARLARKAVYIYTLVHGERPGLWEAYERTPGEMTWITKGMAGRVAFVMSWREIVARLHGLGFETVDVVAHPVIGGLNRQLRLRRTLVRRAVSGAAPPVFGVARDRLLRRRQEERVRDVLNMGWHPAYLGFIASH